MNTTILTILAKFGSCPILLATREGQIFGTYGKLWFLGHISHPGTPRL